MATAGPPPGLGHDWSLEQKGGVFGISLWGPDLQMVSSRCDGVCGGSFWFDSLNLEADFLRDVLSRSNQSMCHGASRWAAVGPAGLFPGRSLLGSDPDRSQFGF